MHFDERHRSHHALVESEEVYLRFPEMPLGGSN